MDLSNLQSRVSSSYIPPHRTQLHPRMHTLSPLSSFLPTSKSSSSPLQSPKDNKFLIIAAASLFIIPFIFYLCTIARGIHKSQSRTTTKLFGIVIHAHVTGSRISVFQLVNGGMVVPVGRSVKVRPGLKEFADDPAAAGTSVEKLVQFAKRYVPKSEWRYTMVQLKSSVDLEEAIFDSCRKVLRVSGFYFEDEWASVMQAEDEGVYAWVAANHALGTLGKGPQETTGIVELGGDSLQIAFAQEDPLPVLPSRAIKLAGVTYNLYTKSIPHLGQDAVYESLVELRNWKTSSASSKPEKGFENSPCIRQGYDHTSNPVGNFSACKAEAISFLKSRQDNRCMHPPCEILSSFLVDSQGKPFPSDKFLYVSELFGVAGKGSLKELEAAGQIYCEEDWEKLKEEEKNIEDIDLLRYCLSSAYFAVLVHESVGIDKRINESLKGVANDWRMGAFVMQRMGDRRSSIQVDGTEKEQSESGEIVGNEAVTYLSVSAVLLFALLGVFLLLKLQKPHLKTIYDLEKGRYIVTRIR